MQRPGELLRAEDSKVTLEAVQVMDEGKAANPGDDGIAVKRIREGEKESFRAR